METREGKENMFHKLVSLSNTLQVLSGAWGSYWQRCLPVSNWCRPNDDRARAGADR